MREAYKLNGLSRSATSSPLYCLRSSSPPGPIHTIMFSTVAIVGAFAGLTVASQTPLVTPVEPAALSAQLSTSCGASGEASCHNTTEQTNLCCFESPGVSVHVMFTRATFVNL